MAQQYLQTIRGQDPYGGLRLGIEGFFGGLQQRQAGQQLAQLFPNLNAQNITDPRIQAIAGQLGLQQQQIAGRPIAQPTAPQLRVTEALRQGLRPGTPEFRRIIEGPVTPSQQISQIQLDRMNLLEEKEKQGNITKSEEAELNRSRQRNRPLVEFGVLPGLTGLLTPPERAEQARQPLKRPLTSTEIKGVDAVVKEILGEPRTLPFGVGRGFAVPQSEIGKLWEQTMLETGYGGRSKIAQKQIESRFDRRIKELNTGKGLGVLANQYEWDRKKYESKTIRNITKEQFDSALRKITNPAAKQRYINQNWRQEFGRSIK